MSDQALHTLRAAGFNVRPTATLDRDGALFALTEDTLIYLDDRSQREVNLRDVTRIHSDRDGVLRVETNQGTAITAPLVGFEVPRVQHFFAEVRHATARAKTLPTPPSVTAASPWKTSFGMDQEAAQTSTTTVVRPLSTTPASAPEPQSPASAPVTTNARTADPAAFTEPHLTAPMTAPVPEPTAAQSEPIRISTAARRDEPATEPPPPPASAGQGSAPQLARFAPTLRLLAILMGITGLGVGTLTWQAGAPLSGLWTIGVGSVGAFALYVFSEVVRAISHLTDTRANRE